MAQTWRSGRGGAKARAPRPLDPAALDRFALRYVERYATTRAKLASYLKRKIRERGWESDTPPAVDAIVARFAELRYVDDAAFAVARGASLTRRGYGVRRVSATLKAAGIEDEDAAPAEDAARDEAFAAALTFARRKRIGPFAAAPPDPAARQKALAAMLRAGHDFGIAREILDLAPDDVPEWTNVNRV